MKFGTIASKLKAKLCSVDPDSFIVHVKTEHVYGDIAKDVA